MEKNILAYIVTDQGRKGYVMNPEWALNGRNPQQSLVNTFSTKEIIEE
jgi:hypothetical protein